MTARGHEPKVHEEETYLKDFCPICSASGAVRALCECVCSTPSKAMECWSRPLDHWLAQSFNAHAPVSSTLPRNALQSLLITVNYQRPWLRASWDYKQLYPLFMRTLELLSNLDLINQHWI